MNNNDPFRDALLATKVLKPPKHRLATFGTTTLHYVLLSGLPDQPDRCRLREGDVTAQRPQILTPEKMRQRFEGFGENAEAQQAEIEHAYGEALRGLEYNFRNDLKTTSVEHTPLPETTDRILRLLEQQDGFRTALLQGPDDRWAFSVMKFIIDISLHSFPGNVRELDERGMFNPAQREATRQRMEIERLFLQAQRDPEALSKLGEYLRQTGLFADYEDRFFSIVKR